MTARRVRGLALAVSLAAGLVDARAADSGAAAAKALDLADTLREVQSAVNLTKGLTLVPSSKTLRDGDVLTVTIELPKSGYLNVVSLDATGEPTVLFPNRYQSDNKVEAGHFVFPNAQMPFQIRAQAPFGTSRIAAFLTTEPLNLYLNGDAKADGVGAALTQFAHLSLAGRDLINLFANRGLQSTPSQTPLTSGLTSVLLCAKEGPCGDDAGQPSPIARIVDAIVPGILLDKSEDIPAAKAVSRPVSAEGVLRTKTSEGFVPQLYLDMGGLCTIAYGHLLRQGGCATAERNRYRQGISEPAGADLLAVDMRLAQRAVGAYVTVPLSDDQYASLVDFTYNVGSGNLKRSTLLKAVNGNQHDRVPAQMLRWTRAGNREYRGLRIRREREIALYFKGSPIPKGVDVGADVSPVDIRAGETPRSQ